MTLEEHKHLLKQYEAAIDDLAVIRRGLASGNEWYCTMYSINYGIPIPAVAAERFVADHIARLKAGANEMAAALGITPDASLN